MPELDSAHRPQRAGGGGGAQSMSAIDLVAFSWGRLPPLGGDRRRGAAQLLRGAEMWLKTSGSDAGGPAAGGGGLLFWVGGFGGTPLRGWRPCWAGRNLGARGHRPRVVVSGRWWGGKRVSVPPSRMHWPLTHRGGGKNAVAGIGKKCGKCGKNAENAAKNAIENAVLLEWCLPLETPMFRLVLHNWALKAWTV